MNNENCLTNKVFIADIASFLPNAPVVNDKIEDVLGMVDGQKSRSRRIVLRSNGIITRHYAIDPTSGKFTHNNAKMTAEAVRELLKKSSVRLDEIDCLSCGTSSPDQLQPAHGCMVQGELSMPPTEVATTSGVCLSGITAMKYAYTSIASGMTGSAVATGSEFASSAMRSSYFETDDPAKYEELKNKPSLAFEKDFLRWMLSDGAGAALLTNKPNSGRTSLRIDWIDILSFSGNLPVCMYAGGVKREDGSFEGMREVDDPQKLLKEHYLVLKQDARILDEHILPVSAQTLVTIAAKRGLQPDEITWFLPHYSSEYFRTGLHDAFADGGFPIPFEKWFTNLPVKGNVGAASIYLIIEELFYSGRLKPGDRLLCYIPESARFSIGYMLLTVV